MKTWVAPLRGISVGGHTVPMKKLRELMEANDLYKVRTHIQNGNLVFQAPTKSLGTSANLSKKDLVFGVAYLKYVIFIQVFYVFFPTFQVPV